MGPASIMEHAHKLLDFSSKFDIQLLDHVVSRVYASGDSSEQARAQAVLTELSDHPDSWAHVDSILEYSQYQNTKFYALQILDKLIKTRWKVLPQDQRDGIKGFIINLLIKLTQDNETREKERVFVSKMNLILVAILKQDWPINWPTFIGDIVNASRSNESLCQNNMQVLKLLSEEIFDFSDQMTAAKTKALKDAMCSEFLHVFNLCIYVLESSEKPGLIVVTLETLLRFLDWIPLNYIFDTKLIDTLVFKFLPVPLFRNITIQCLTEVAALHINSQYDETFVKLYSSLMQQLKTMLPPSTNVAEAYAGGNDDEQNFIQNLSLLLTTYLKEHGKLLEGQTSMLDALIEGHEYLVLISRVDETEIFKICLDYWNHLAAALYRDPSFTAQQPTMPQSFASPFKGMLGPLTPRRQLYSGVLSQVRSVMISRMAKPEEVLVVENDQGEIVREYMKDTDAINMYKSMRETLIWLTHLDYADTDNIMTQRLQAQVDGTEWSWKNLNTLCWAIGSISGAMDQEDEKRFLVTVIKELLGLCEMKRGKDNKAVIASNIMYIVGQYPRFLCAHWRFLKTVVYKLFEFMHETHDGVQDMACDTFIKIARKCRRHFVQIQVGEVDPFIDEILTSMNSVICDLQPAQIHTFYEAVGYMISSQSDTTVRDCLIERLMEMPNNTWDNIIAQCAKSTDVLKEPGVLKALANILKTNISACSSTGHPFVSQLGRIYLDMLNVYNCVSECISLAIQQSGEMVTKTPLIRSMRTVKKDVLYMIETWMTRSEDPRYVCDNFIPPLLDAVLGDYARNIPQAREAEVLAVMTAIVNKLEGHITKDVPVIFDGVFECTLSMINQDLAMYPEHRTNFFLLLRAVNQHCFPAFFVIQERQFKLVIDSITWALKHTMRNIADTGLSILYDLFQNVSTSDVAQQFYQTFFLGLLEYILLVLTDTSHKSGFKMQTTILAYMLSLVESGAITVPLFDRAARPDIESNEQFVKEHIAVFLRSQFAHLTQQQIHTTVVGLFSFNKSLPEFKTHIRDFLVESREFAGEDNADLYLEEKEASMRAAEEEKHKIQSSIPGMLGPHAMPDEMAD